MCGIFGVVFRDGQTIPDDDRLQDTIRLLGHRGPDNAGTFSRPGIGLAHTRLALLDLSDRGNQPFWDDSGRYALVYNGEIYNFHELRSGLEERGVRFRTDCDTEVLLNGILHYGLDDLFQQLEGMFAFGLWDDVERRLVLCRDRFGIKPLSIYEDRNVLVFASEVKALAPWVPLHPDPHITSAYLAGFGGPTRTRSFFQNVSVLPPGTVKELRCNRPSQDRSLFHVSEFWNRDDYERLGSLSEAALVDHFEDLISSSVKKHLLADAPVGALCSGGLDSSLVMAMASRMHPNLAIFHANVEGPLSEFEAANALSKHLRLEMMTVDVKDQDFVEHLPSVINHYEYPFSHHPNSVPFLLVSRLVERHGVKAILSGEGSDECFLGYGPIAYEDLRQRYRRMLDVTRQLVHRLPKIGKALWPIGADEHSQVYGLQQNFEVSIDETRVRERIREVGLDVRPREYRSLNWLGYHLRTLLHRNDALGMAASIEARFPYLDHDLVRSAVNLPYKYKIRPSLTAFDRTHPFLRDKWIVRKIAGRYVPRMLSQRRKLGFPVNAYERMSCSHDYFKDGFVADFYRLAKPELSHLLSGSDQSLRVRLLMLETWGRLFVRQETADDLSARLLGLVSIDPIRT